MLGAGASCGRPRPGLSRKLPGEVASSPSLFPSALLSNSSWWRCRSWGPRLGAGRHHVMGHSRDTHTSAAAYNGLSGAICNNSCNSLDRWS